MKPILTIAIPTWNRAAYLEKNLIQLSSELKNIKEGLVEILVSDNFSTDGTESSVQKIKNKHSLPLKYIKNEKNLGWGLNFFQCFNFSKGKYVLILGDDDLLYDDALGYLVEKLLNTNYGVVSIRPYGFNDDFRLEYPGRSKSREKVYKDDSKFLLDINSIMRMISSSIINKEIINDFDTTKINPGNFAHLHLIFTALLKAKENLFLDKFLVATMRNNSSNYDFYEIFVVEYWSLLDSYIPKGLKKETIKKMQNDMLFTYYPYYALKERMSNNQEGKETIKYFKVFHNSLLFKVWLAPTLKWPKVLAVFWGAMTTFVGRTYNGELLRGISFLWKSVIKAKFK